MADFGPGGRRRDGLVVGGEVGLQGRFLVADAVVGQGALARALAPDADDPFQGVVGAAGGGQQGVPRPQQPEQGHRQGVGAAHELAAHQRVLAAHGLGKDGLQLGPAVSHRP